MAEDKDNKGGIDLSGALKGSDTGVKFEDQWQRSSRAFYPGTPKIIQWTIKYSGGLIKNERQASYTLLGFVALAIIVVLFLIFSAGGTKIEERNIFNPETAEPDVDDLRNR